MKCKYYAKVGPISRLRYCMLLLPEICTWHHCTIMHTAYSPTKGVVRKSTQIERF